MFACLRGDIQLIDCFMKHKPNLNLKDANNRNALFYIINADKGDNADLILTLILKGINVNEPEKIGNHFYHSPLTLAVSKEMKNTVKILLENGADVNYILEKDGNTALHYAVNNTNIEIIELLLLHGGNVKVINAHNFTPLSLALKISNTEVYKIVVEEHNKLAKIENENVSTLLKEDDLNSLQNINSNVNSNNKKKRKNKDENQPNNYEDNHLIKEHNYSQEINVNLHENLNKENNYSEEIKISNPDHSRKIHYYNKKKNLKQDIVNYLRDKKRTKDKMSITNSDLHLNLEIPIEFKEKIHASNLSLNSYISKIYLNIPEIQNTPILHIDLSDKKKEDATILSWQNEELNRQLIEKDKRMKAMEESLKLYSEEVKCC
jgi:ankyrin repeat protein